MKKEVEEKIISVSQDLTDDQAEQLKFLMSKAEESGPISQQLLIDEFGITQEEADIPFQAFSDIMDVAAEPITEEEYHKEMAKKEKGTIVQQFLRFLGL